MQRGPTANDEVTALRGRQVRVIVPWPLPPRPPLVLDDALQLRILNDDMEPL